LPGPDWVYTTGWCPEGQGGGTHTTKAPLDKLKEISFFGDVPESDLRQIAEIMELRSYRTGAVIIRELSEADRFFIIYRGKIEITKKLDRGEELVLAVRGDGDFFGEMALLDARPRSASARAVEHTTVLEISRSDFDVFLYKAPRLAFRLMRELSGRLRDTDALLISHLQQNNRLLFRSNLDTIAMVIEAIERRDQSTIGRTRRITDIAMMVGRELGLADDELLILELSTLLRDLGMLAMPEGLLEKKGPLTPDEYALVKTHTGRIRDMIGGIPFLERAIPHVMHHHERYDGSGYPEGLAGERIPLSSRIIAVVDAFGAMTGERPYRERLDSAEAVARIQGLAGVQFDPGVVEVFVKLWESGALQDHAQGNGDGRPRGVQAAE
jgi:HD-GYP domain-containing protein (c-di-GMP phosphodiesterase class II)